MIITIHNQITFDINQIIDRHIQMHNQECVLINIQILTLKIIKSNKNQTKAIREIETPCDGELKYTTPKCINSK